MLLKPAFDIGWGIGLFWGYYAIAAYTLPLIILIEWAVFRHFLSGRSWFWKIVVVNVLSGVLGYYGNALIGFPMGNTASEYFGASYYSADLEAVAAMLGILLLVSWLLSVVIEGGLLWLMAKEVNGRQFLRALLLSNTGSYLIFTLLGMIFYVNFLF